MLEFGMEMENEEIRVLHKDVTNVIPIISPTCHDPANSSRNNPANSSRVSLKPDFNNIDNSLQSSSSSSSSSILLTPIDADSKDNDNDSNYQSSKKTSSRRSSKSKSVGLGSEVKNGDKKRRSLKG